MPIHRPSPLLPWDAIGLIIEANWIKLNDFTTPKENAFSFKPSETFSHRYGAFQQLRKELTAWMLVSKETKAIASKLYYYCIAFVDLQSLILFKNLVQNPSSSESQPPAGSLVRYFSLCPFVGLEAYEIWEDGDQTTEWFEEMARLVPFLPNIKALRGSGRWSRDEERVFAEMLHGSSLPLEVLHNFIVDSREPSLAFSFLQQSSKTLQYLKIIVHDPVPLRLSREPSSYPLLTFPSLIKLEFVYADVSDQSLFLAVASSRWILPSLRTFATSASSIITPFLDRFGPQIRHLGLSNQDNDDHSSYEGWFDLCPNMEILSLEIWDPEDTEFREKPAALDIRNPISSVRTVTLYVNEQVKRWSSDTWININVPQMVNKTNFPSLSRVVVSSRSDVVSETLLAWGRTLVEQCVVVEFN